MRVSMGVLPTSLTKKSCSITEAETVRREGSLRRSFPNLVGWLGYWVRQYSSRAHWDFSCSCSITGGEVRPTASENILISWELWRDFKIAWDLFDEIFSKCMIFCIAFVHSFFKRELRSSEHFLSRRREDEKRGERREKRGGNLGQAWQFDLAF